MNNQSRTDRSPLETSSEDTSRPDVVLVEDIWKSYDEGAIQVLNGVSLRVGDGETVALCGPSGCGKSTLLHLMGGLDTANRGSVTLHGERLGPRTDTVHLLRHQVGFVFQLHNLIADLTLEENCLLPTVAAGVPQAQAKARLDDLLRRTGLAHRSGQKIQKLSGGERQRTALCRALMNRPRILLADEPTGALDERTREQVFELLMDLVRDEGVTLIMATHDLDLAGRCDRLIEMHDGRIAEPAEVSEGSLPGRSSR